MFQPRSRLVPGLVITLALFGAVVAGLMISGSGAAVAASPEGAASTQDPDGRALYLKHCASCHGERGFGDGDAAYLLYPRPRDFSKYHFRLVSTSNGVPSDEDLFQVVTRGMLGSGMPPHQHLSEAERKSVVKEVRRLMTEEGMKRLLEEAQRDGDEMDEATARDVAFKTPGPRVDLPSAVASTPELIAEGRVSYVRNCSLCHDLDGTGRSRSDMKDSLDHPLFARDFTAGIMKGGTEAVDIWRRIRCGMPGTPMPAAPIGDRETWALVHYVRSMIRPGAQERLAQRPLRLDAQRVSAALTTDPAADVWKTVPARWLSMTPLWWKEPRVEGVLLQAAHDGRSLALRLVWEDASRDADQSGAERFSDAAAVQWSRQENPPFFAMGEKGQVVDIWYWRAVYQEDQGGWQDVARAHPRVVNDIDASLRKPPFGSHDKHSNNEMSAYDPLFLTAWGANNPVADPKRPTPVETLHAGGFGTLSPRLPPFSKTDGRARHERGFWELVIIRSLDDGGAGLSLSAGAEVSCAFAVWNGTAGNRNGEKNVTIWHRLSIGR
ncbi:MAG: hypothetical protein CMJ83_22860 [Planctomycetes bacterium]|nr:hypothetical protein [Planctomycetota bacterium]